jgi:hypothetical protein
MIKISLSHGDVTAPRRFALVDDEDADLARIKWCIFHLSHHSDAAIRIRRTARRQLPATQNYLNREVWLRAHGSFSGVHQIRHRNGDSFDCRRANLIGTNYREKNNAPKPKPPPVAARLPRSVSLSEHHECPRFSGLLSGVSYRTCWLRAQYAPGAFTLRYQVCEECPIGVAVVRRFGPKR